MTTSRSTRQAGEIPGASSSTDVLRALLHEFPHPAIVLWRSVELATALDAVREYARGRILDLASGEGRVARVLFGSGQVDVGIDIDPSFMSAAMREGIFKHVVTADATRLPFDHQSFDFIFSNSSIEHIPALTAVLSEVARVLKPDAFFVFTVPSHNLADYFFYKNLFDLLGLKKLGAWYATERNRRLNHFHCYDHLKWHGLLADSNMQMVSHRYYLSKTAIYLWEILASLGLLGRILRLTGAGLALWGQSGFARSLEQRAVARLVQRFFAGDGTEGAGLLVVARRN